jgi:hypothetical protein
MYELNDTLYAKANIQQTEEVYLWLGANVMLSYPLKEAEELLESKLASAKQNMANTEEDLDFLREQITVSRSDTVWPITLTVWQTMEVATARVYNWDVVMRRKEKEQGAEAESRSEKR